MRRTTILVAFLLLCEIAAGDTAVILVRRDVETITPPTPRVTTQSSARSSVPKRAVDAFVGGSFQTDRIEGVVTSVEIKNQVGNVFLQSRAAEGGVYVAVQWAYKNISAKPLSAANRPELFLLDRGGVQYTPDLQATFAFASQLDVTEKALSDLNPGVRVQSAAVFEVSRKLFNSDTWVLFVKADRGVKIALKPKMKETAVTHTAGGTPIVGAFGFKLGDTFKPDSNAQHVDEDVYGTRLDSLNGNVYRVEPPARVAPFEHYYVVTTPLTNKVFQIHALTARYNDNPYGCRDSATAVRSAIAKKYGGDADTSVFRRGSRSIQVDCFMYDPVTIDYIDWSLEKVGEREFKKRSETEASKKVPVDDKGL